MAGEPNNLGDEDYTVTNFGGLGKWNDVPDWVTPQFIVEFVDSDGDGTMDVCDNCPEDPNKTEPGICGCGTSDVDSDCDGIADCNDICPGGDDTVDANGDLIPDCSQLLDYDEYSDDWKCANNKIMVCHNGNNPHSICINKNALSAHFNHGDNVGPCTSCGNAIKVQDHYEDVEGDHDHALEDAAFRQ
ncbi:MAG: hypothetical protein IPO62_12995 [Saprospiraceae bacterium]|nr:hypothetical protein [Saprospiraceae bacterium]